MWILKRPSPSSLCILSVIFNPSALSSACWQSTHGPKCSQKSFKKKKTLNKARLLFISADSVQRRKHIHPPLRSRTAVNPQGCHAVTNDHIHSAPIIRADSSVVSAREEFASCRVYFIFFPPCRDVAFSMVHLPWGTWLYFVSVIEKGKGEIFLQLSDAPRLPLHDVTLELM